MASLLDFLGAVGAQINPWDNGDTYDSFMKRRKREDAAKQVAQPQAPITNSAAVFNPLATPASLQPKPPVLTAGQLSSDLNLKLSRQQIRRKNLAEIQAIQDKAKADIWNPAKIAGDVGKAAGDVGNAVGQFFGGNTAKLVNTANYGVVTPLAELAQGKSEQQVKQNMDKNLFSNKSGIFGAGTFFPTKQAYNKTVENPVNFAKGFTGAGVSTAAEVAPMARGASLLAKKGLTTGQKVVRGALEGGAYGAAATAGAQAVNQQQFNPLDIAKGGLAGAALGGAVPALGYAKPAVQATAKAVEQRNPKVIAANHPKVVALDNHVATLQQSFDTTQNQIARHQIAKAIEAAQSERNAIYNQEVRKLTQGGYAKVPGAKPEPTDPLQALKQEALKYKSAEEFVNSQSKRPAYKQTAFEKKFSKSTKKSAEQAGFSNLKSIDTAETPEFVANRIKGLEDDVNRLGENWFGSDKHAYNKQLLEYYKRKQQLTDLYNQAHTEAKAPKISENRPEAVYDSLGFPDGRKNTLIPIEANGKVVGGIDANVHRFKPDTLVVNHMRILPGSQGKGAGTNAVAKLFNDNPKINFIEGHATAESKSFWKKQGATFSGSENNIFTINRPQAQAKTPTVQAKATSDVSPETFVTKDQMPQTVEQTQITKTSNSIQGQRKKIQSFEESSQQNLARQQRSTAAKNRQFQSLPEPGLQSQDNPARSYPNDMSKQEIKQYVKDMTDAQDIARKANKKGIKEKAGSAKSDFKAKAIDDLAPIEDRLNKAIKNGAVVDPKDHITYQLDRSRRSEGLVDAYLTEKGFDKVIQNVPDTKEFDQYLIARHAKELDPSITTGRDAAKDAALVKSLDGKYGEYAKQVYKYNQELLDKAVDYGLIAKSTATKLRKQYPEYVPFNRIFNEDELASLYQGSKAEASISSQSAVQKIKGSKRAIESPLNSIIDKTRVVIEQGERNKSAQMLASYRKLPGNPFNLKEIPANETIGQRHTISFLDNGKKRTFEVDKEVAEAAKHMTREQIGLWGRVLSLPARMLRAGATTVNVGFAGANIVKDVVGAAINSRHPFRIAEPKAFGKALAAALNHSGQSYHELMREGVAGTSFDMYRNSAKLNIAEIRSHKNAATRAAYTAVRPQKWYRGLENAIGRSEDFGRALQYYSNKSGFEKKLGKDSLEARLLAADQARNNSTNFFRHGSSGKNINRAIPYWNAGVQGARIQTRRIIERPAQTLGKIGFVIAAPAAIVAMHNYATEENRKIMQNIPDYEKENNIIILGNNPKFNEDTGRWEDVYKFPVPPQHLGVYNTVQRAVESAATGKPYDIMKSLGGIVENYTTINPTDGRKTLSNYTPQAMKLFAEPITNTNFFSGDKIVPDSLKNLAAKDQKYKSTSAVAEELGKVTGLSPLQIDNSIRTAFGGAGQNFVNMADVLLIASGVSDKKEAGGRNLIGSITGRFVGAKGRSDGQLYFESLDKAAKDQKLAGKDLSIYNSLVESRIGSTGEIEGKTERDALNKYQNLASHPNVAKAVSRAALELSKQTGKQHDPLYDLPHDKQMKFYNIKAQNRDSQDQRDLENKEKSWYTDFTKKRATYFKTVDFKPNDSNRVKYPEPDTVTQKNLDTYYAMPNGQAKWSYLDKHPEIIKHFNNLAKYTNDVRVAQGVGKLRTYPQASKRVQQLMDAGQFKDPEVSKYLQDLNVYKLTKDAALAQIQGNDLSPAALKSMRSLSKYNLVKNPDGTYALQFSDTQGTGMDNKQPGFSTGGYGGFGSGGKKKIGTRDIAKETLGIRAPKTSGKTAKVSGVRPPQLKKTPLKAYSVKKSTTKKVKTKVSRA